MSESSKYFDFISSQPNGVQFLHSNEEDGLHFWGYLTAPTAQGTSGVLGGLICYDEVGADFVKEALTTSHFLVVNIYNKSLIGFSCVNYFVEDGRTYYYIDLICNRSAPPYSLRSYDQIEDPRLGARAMIDIIEQKAREAGCEYVKLRAIEKVISYYANLGYFFPGVTSERRIKEAKELISQLRTAQKNENTSETDKIYEEIVRKYYPDYFSDTFQSSLTSTDPRARRSEAVVNIKSQGIPMIKYLHDTPETALIEAPRPSFPGGKRKTKKRRYKSKSKRNKRKSKARKQRKNKTKRRKSKK